MDCLQELEQESQTTRRVLERVPNDKLAWRPHQKARTLGELALHVATVPGGVAQLVASPSPVQAPQFADPSPKSSSELIPALDESIANAKKALGGMDDATLMATWRTDAGRPRAPRGAAYRNFTVGDVEPLVPPSRTADGLSPRAGRGDSFDLRPERRREPVRLMCPAGSRRDPACAEAEIDDYFELRYSISFSRKRFVSLGP